MEALVEVHNEAEAEQAVRCRRRSFGINNRDLHTFDVDLATTERLRPLLPRDAVVVGESGVTHKRRRRSACTRPASTPSSSARRS